MGHRNVYFSFLPPENLKGFLEVGSIFYGWAERGCNREDKYNALSAGGELMTEIVQIRVV